MDEEVPLENVAVRMESIRTAVPFAPNAEKESDVIPERNARPPSKRLSMNSSHEEGGLLQRQKFSREIRLDSEPISTQRPPLVGGRNSLRLIPSCEEQDNIQSVLSPSHSTGGGGYSISPRTSIRVDSMSSHRGSMRIDQSMIDSILASSAAANRDSVSTKVTIQTAISIVPCNVMASDLMTSRISHGYSVTAHANSTANLTPIFRSDHYQDETDVSDKTIPKRIRANSTDTSGRSTDVYDETPETATDGNDETRSSDSEEEDEDIKNVTNLFSEETDSRFESRSMSRQDSKASMDKHTEGSVQGSVQMNGEDETFDDQVQCMDLNIETLNEQGRSMEGELKKMFVINCPALSSINLLYRAACSITICTLQLVPYQSLSFPSLTSASAIA